MLAAHRRGVVWLVAAGAIAASCSLSPLDDLTRNHVDGGSCERGVQCSGCATCASFCDCVVASDVVECILSCQGSGGSGGGAPADGASDAAGGSGGSGGSCVEGDKQLCSTCCDSRWPGGLQAYSDTIEQCVCGPGAPCEMDCGPYCSGGPMGTCQTCLGSQAGIDCSNAHCPAQCAEFSACYFNCGR